MFNLKYVFVNNDKFSVSGRFLNVQFKSKKGNIYESEMFHDFNSNLSPTKALIFLSTFD